MIFEAQRLVYSQSMIKTNEQDLRIVRNDEDLFLPWGSAALADDDYRNDESDGNSPQHSDHYSYNHDQAVVGLCTRIVVLLSCGEQTHDLSTWITCSLVKIVYMQPTLCLGSTQSKSPPPQKKKKHFIVNYPSLNRQTLYFVNSYHSTRFVLQCLNA